MLLPHSNLLPSKHSKQLRALKVELNDQPYTKGLYAYIHNKNRHSPKAQWIEGILREKIQQHINNQD